MKRSFADYFIHTFELLLIWMIGGDVYYGIELLWRGYSHESMFILGGICLVLIGLLNEIPYTKNWYFEQQVLVGDLIVLVLEFFTGCVVNIGLGLNVWNYSDQPGNILGQICPLFASLWLPVIMVAIVLDDFIKWKYLGYPKRTYTFYIDKIIQRCRR